MFGDPTLKLSVGVEEMFKMFDAWTSAVNVKNRSNKDVATDHMWTVSAVVSFITNYNKLTDMNHPLIFAVTPLWYTWSCNKANFLSVLQFRPRDTAKADGTASLRLSLSWLDEVVSGTREEETTSLTKHRNISLTAALRYLVLHLFEH